MDGSSESPIKAFWKRHSPIKRRNKPLPAAPRKDESPTKQRAPMRAVSNNISPTKDSKAAKRNLSGFIRNKPSGSEEPAQSNKHRRIASVPSQGSRAPSVPAQDLPKPKPGLADRVHRLEAQLEAARAELAQAAASASPRKAISPRRSRPPTTRRAHSYEVYADSDRDAATRHERLLRGTHYDGLVESLLEQDYESANARAASYSTGAGTGTNRHGISESGRHSALASYGDLENNYMDDDEDETEHLKRKRSELRAAEWRRIQEKYDHSTQLQSGSSSKRTRDSITAVTDEPPARRQKQSHNVPGERLPRDKSLPQLPQQPQHSRRSASESHAPTSMELGRSVDQPIQSQPYKIEYVRTKPRTPEDEKAPIPSRTPTGRPTYDLMAAFGSNTPNARAAENVEVFGDADDEPEETVRDPPPNSPYRRASQSPSKLQTVTEEFEWDDEVF